MDKEVKMELNKDNLENSLGETEKPREPEKPQMPKEMEIGFHQGALNTLVAERAELIEMIKKVEKIISMHIQRLEQLGVKVQTKKAEEQ
jgi:argininosuccinate synthase